MRALIAAMLVLGCATTESTSLNAAPRPMAPRDPEDVQVFSGSAPSSPHVAVALLNSAGEMDTAGNMKSLRDKAAAMGCEGLILGNIQASGGGIIQDTGAGILVPLGGGQSLQGTCIMFKDPEAGKPAPKPAPGSAPGAKCDVVPGTNMQRCAGSMICRDSHCVAAQ